MVLESVRATKAVEAAEASSLRRILEVAATEAAAVHLEFAGRRVACSARERDCEANQARLPPAVPAALRAQAGPGPLAVADAAADAAAPGAGADARLDAARAVHAALLARREEAARGVLSSLLASQLERLVWDAFSAWRSLKDRQSLEEALAAEAAEAASLRSSLERAMIEADGYRRAAADAQAAMASEASAAMRSRCITGSSEAP